ncbi:hypothetical protein [Psychroflexus sp. MBR-150]|jgi:hypothetical protein
MAIKIKNNKVVITLEDEGNDAIDALRLKRQAVYDAIIQHNRRDYIQSDEMYYGLVEFLRETEPDEKQYRQMLSLH